MPTTTVSIKNTNYFSNLICDYIDEEARLLDLYNRFPKLENFKSQIEEKGNTFTQEKREVLVSVLQEQYKSVNASAETLKHIEVLKSNQTFTITTGHQLNLFTGPLYFLYKILSVVNLCKTLKINYPEQHFVPVFWMASEDHDFDEISFFNFRRQKVQWAREVSGGVGRLNTKGLEKVFSEFAKQLGSSRNAEDIKHLFTEAYINHDNLADATRYLGNALFKTYGLVIIDADHKELKRLFIPQITSELTQQVTHKNVSNTNAKLEDLGYKVQVNPREINLFYLGDNLRERLVKEENGFKVNDTELRFSEVEVFQELENHPERFSPNVLMRPLYQEVVLPNLCYIGGGGEMAYWFQLKTSFEAQDVPFPMLLLRDSVLIRTEKQKQKQESLGISDTDLFLNKNNFINKYVRRISNIDIDFSPQKIVLQEQFKALYSMAEQTDKSFLGAVKAQEVKQLKGLQHLEKRLLKAQKKVLADKIERSTGLKEVLFPNGSLQERQLNFSELYLEYGPGLVDELAKHLNPLDMRFLLLTI